MDKDFKRWRIPFIGRGAINQRLWAGHHRVFGIVYCWNGGTTGWSRTRSLSFWGLFAVRHNDTRGGTLKSSAPHGWSFTRAHFNFKAAFRRADTHVA